MVIRSDENMLGEEKVVCPYSYWEIIIRSDDKMNSCHMRRRQFVHILIGRITIRLDDQMKMRQVTRNQLVLLGNNYWVT